MCQIYFFKITVCIKVFFHFLFGICFMQTMSSTYFRNLFLMIFLFYYESFKNIFIIMQKYAYEFLPLYFVIWYIISIVYNSIRHYQTALFFLVLLLQIAIFLHVYYGVVQKNKTGHERLCDP